MILDMLEYYNMLKRMGVDIVYSGPLGAGSVETLGSTLKKRLEFQESALSVSQSVFSVFVEQMNNMLMYSTEKEHYDFSDGHSADAPKGVFVIGTRDNQYFLQSGNRIRTSSVEALKERINLVNTLDKAELRKLYKEQIKKPNNNPESKGAGLGIIEIAKRANGKIAYEFVPLDDEFSFFTMYVMIG